MASSSAGKHNPQVHFITTRRRCESVPVAQVLSRIHVDVNGAIAAIRGTRTALQSLTVNGKANLHLADGTPLWNITFTAPSARRPPRAATNRIMGECDWLGVMFSCRVAHEQMAVEDAAASMSSNPVVVAKYGPCRYGASCKDKGDARHCAKYSHPEGPIKCSTPGCNRLPGGRYPTCCAHCTPSSGRAHTNSCQTVATVVVEDVYRDGEDWILLARSLSSKAASIASRVCRYGCGMQTARVEDRSFDTCCRRCATTCGTCRREEHDPDCGGWNEEAMNDFSGSINLSTLLPAASSPERGRYSRASFAARKQTPAAAAPKECGICFDEMDGAPVSCQLGHSFCNSCMVRHVAEELGSKGVLPACPLSAQCGHLLTRDQVEDILHGRQDAIMSRFDLLAQRAGLQALGAFPCARESCQDWIVPSKPGKQQLVECPACKIRFCSLCRRKPYHWRIFDCADTSAVDNAWHDWLRSGRDDYVARLAMVYPEFLNVLGELNSKKAEQAKMLAEAEARKKEFLEMEEWKVQNCKCCPKCRRVINKIDGCDSMVCGRNYHGGDVQNGCGTSFKWTAAPAYQRQAADHVPSVDKPTAGPAPQLVMWEYQPGSYLRCAMCKRGIEGPLFLCIDCPACCACLLCANGLGSAAGGQHQPDSHVFSIYWKLEDLPTADLENLVSNHLSTRRKPRALGMPLAVGEEVLCNGQACVIIRIDVSAQHPSYIVRLADGREVGTERHRLVSRLDLLTDMGFPADDARRALADAKGDVTTAADMLTHGGCS